MRPRLLRWLACPLCRGRLQLLIEDCERRRVSDAEVHDLSRVAPVDDPLEIQLDVRTGALTCEHCGVFYPVWNGVPRMLVYRTPAARLHVRTQASWIATQLAGVHLPDASPPPGEPLVLRSMSNEPAVSKLMAPSGWSAACEKMVRCQRDELGVPRHGLKHRLVLQVGIGIGAAVDGLSRAEDCELVGVDLGATVDEARAGSAENHRFHVVQASVFALPFPPGTFDVVYCHGVLHHTYSTRWGFRHLATLPKPGSGMLSIWVSSAEQARVTLRHRISMVLEHAVRPILARLPRGLQTIGLLPFLPFYLRYRNADRRRPAEGEPASRLGLHDALRDARDQLTPLFAHRHTYDEVIEWFQAESYTGLELLRDEIVPSGLPWTYPVHVGVRGFRGATLPTA